MRKLLMIGITAMLMMAPLAASARVGVLIAPGWGWGPYGGPYWWGPYPYYGYYGYYGYVPVAGAVKFDTKVKDAQVYVDGAYAGTVRELKTMYLRPGSYDIEVREPGRPNFDQTIYVTAGKTVRVNPDVRVQPPPQGS
jgi:hypothetical protein